MDVDFDTYMEAIEKIENREKKIAKRTQKTTDRTPSEPSDSTIRATSDLLKERLRLLQERMTSTDKTTRELEEKTNALAKLNCQLGNQAARLIGQIKDFPTGTQKSSSLDCSTISSKYNENLRKLNEKFLKVLEKDANEMQDEEYKKNVDELRAKFAQDEHSFNFSMFKTKSPGFTKAYSAYTRRSLILLNGVLAELARDSEMRLKEDDEARKGAEASQNAKQSTYRIFKCNFPDNSKAYSGFLEKSQKRDEEFLEKLGNDAEKMQDEVYKKEVNEMRANYSKYGQFFWITMSMSKIKSPAIKKAWTEHTTRSMKFMVEMFKETTKDWVKKMEEDMKSGKEVDDMCAKLAQNGKYPDHRMSNGDLSDLLKILPEWMRESRRSNEEMMIETADIMKKYWKNQNYSKTPKTPESAQKVDEKDSEIERLRSLLKAKEEEVAEEKAKFRVQEELTNGLRKWVVEKDAELMVRESQIKVKEAELEEKSKKRTLEVEDLLVEVDEKKSKEEEKETIQKLEDLELDSENEEEDVDSEEYDLLEDH
uniref:PH domain-containing protein n=1 Tax=Caenorhabditis tropicalis TaxID=1561998 RepID=A0A1I7UH40_9PELO